MADLQARLKELETVANNPRAQLDGYLATGKKVVGVFPMYTPEELVYAAGMVPMGLWGGQTEIKHAKAYFPAFACSIMQSTLELGISGAYKGLSAVIIPTLCDVFRCTTQNWLAGCGDIPMIPFTHPQNRVLESAVTFLRSEYALVREKLEAVAGLKITDEALEKSIADYNAHNAVMREFAKVANDHLDVITPNVRHNVMKSGTFMEKPAHTAAVKEIIDGLNALDKHEWKGSRVVLSGITAEPKSFLDIFETNGMAVVGDDLGQESRQYQADIPAGSEDPLTRLARQWPLRICSLAHANGAPHRDALIALAKETKADGVVVCMMKFCDPEEYDFPICARALRAEGIPVCYVEIDQQIRNDEQARTRLQSFAEML